MDPSLVRVCRTVRRTPVPEVRRTVAPSGVSKSGQSVSKCRFLSSLSDKTCQRVPQGFRGDAEKGRQRLEVDKELVWCVLGRRPGVVVGLRTRELPMYRQGVVEEFLRKEVVENFGIVYVHVCVSG